MPEIAIRSESKELLNSIISDTLDVFSNEKTNNDLIEVLNGVPYNREHMLEQAEQRLLRLLKSNQL